MAMTLEYRFFWPIVYSSGQFSSVYVQWTSVDGLCPYVVEIAS